MTAGRNLSTVSTLLERRNNAKNPVVTQTPQGDPPRNSRRVRVGCSGFALSLARYAQAFPVVEVQQTFYQPPLPGTMERWRREAPADFEFTIKAWQLITHAATSPTYRRLRDELSATQKRQVGAFRLNKTVIAAWQRMEDCARILRSRVIQFQCPASFHPTARNKANLRAFFREITASKSVRVEASEFVYVWEPRGAWEPQEVRELCAELGLVHGVDPFVQSPATAGLRYFRLHGQGGYRYRYTQSDLDRLLEMTAAPGECYVFFNNISMLDDAQRFGRMLAPP